MSEVDSSAADPYEMYRYLRTHAPVTQMPDNGPWQVARFNDVHQLLKDYKTFSSDVSMQPPEERQPGMLFSDPPIHNRLRKLVSYAFKPSYIAAQHDMIVRRCEQLVGEMVGQGEVDLVETLAAPLPVTVIAHMLGVVDGDMKTFKYWSDQIFSNIGEFLFGVPSEEAQRCSEDMNGYFLERIAELRRKPVNHVLGRLVETETEDGKLSDEELLSFCRLLLIAGNETTTGLITASVRIFDEMPETFDQVREKPALIPTFIEEALRYYSPFAATIRRTTRVVEIAGVTIPQGALVTPLIGCANRDETVFARADRFVIDRDPNPHLAFGFGIHNCLGAHLARLEGEIAVAALTRHFRTLSLSQSVDAAEGSGLGGPKKLMVRLAA
ncbi:MAG TPA: cytochrome P450 [Pseudomonadales bacterium]|nr:cytochrome P450 [Pseudomonadales bacterium]